MRKLILVATILLLSSGAACWGAEKPQSGESNNSPDPTAAEVVERTAVPKSRDVKTRRPTKTSDAKEPDTSQAASDTAAKIRAALQGQLPTSDVFEDLLGVIPDTPDVRREVWMHDLDRMRQLFPSIPADIENGIYLSVPGPKTGDADAAMWKEILPPLAPKDEYLQNAPICAGEFPLLHASRANLTGMGFGYCGQFNAIDTLDLGYDVRQIKQAVSTGPPDDPIEVIRGDFDTEAANAAVRCQTCPAFDLGEHLGIPFYSWGGDREISRALIFAPPIFDQLGRAGRVMVQEEYVFRTLTTSRMEDLIGAHQKQQKTLRDVEEFRLLAKGLSEAGAYSAFLTNHKWALEEARIALLQQGLSGEDLEKLLDQSLMLRPYQAWSTGSGKDNKGHYMFLVLVHANQELAAENAALLPQRLLEATSAWFQTPWAPEILSSGDEFLGSDSMDISTDGRILIVKFRARNALRPFGSIFYRALLHNDPILLYK